MEGAGLKPLMAAAALLALALARAAYFALGTIGLWHALGPVWAVAGAAAAALWRIRIAIHVGVFLAAFTLWGWPWYAALLLGAPRALLLLPGLISMTVARWRHPRPLWPPLNAANPP